VIVVVTSGNYNPLHVGHLECLRRARDLGDYHIAIVNSDHQVALKGSRRFMNEVDRMDIVKALRCVDDVMLSIDEDMTQCDTLIRIRGQYPYAKIIFAKGGDRHAGEIPEAAVCNELNIQIVDGLGNKIRSSSEILREAGF
jgi:cytidyltransferase-like protein